MGNPEYVPAIVAENKKLWDRIFSLQKENRDLAKKNQKLQNTEIENQQLKNFKNSNESKNARKMKTLKTKVNELEMHVEDLQEELGDQKSALEAHKKKYEELEIAHRKLIAVTQDRYMSLNENFKTSDFKRRIDKLEKESEENYRIFKNDMKNLTEALDRTSEEKSSLESENEKLVLKISQFEHYASPWKIDEITSLRESYIQLQSVLENAEKECQRERNQKNLLKEEFESYQSCSICFELFDENLKCPVKLRCEHVTCKSCAHGNLSNPRNHGCPFCRERYTHFDIQKVNINP